MQSLFWLSEHHHNLLQPLLEEFVNLLEVIMGAIFMYLFAVGGTYFLGIHMGLQAVGAYIAMAGDECARAVGMVLRWKSGKWKSKSLVEL